MKNFKDTLTAKLIRERWSGKDMEEYFENKSKNYLKKLKKDLDM